MAVTDRATLERSAIALDREVVLCSAIAYSGGLIIRGHRHVDCLVTAGGIKAIEQPHAGVQGFLTSRNRFVDREEGWRLQTLAGIPSADTLLGYHPGKLFSEDLY